MSFVDVCVHPTFPNAGDINKYLPKPYRDQRYPPPLAGVLPNPIDNYFSGSYPVDGSMPGSAPALMDQHVLVEPGVAYAVLLPLTRGVLADPQTTAAIDSATNDWLAETWLGEYNEKGCYRGSIRITPRSPGDAIKEIKRWANHPYFVQVAVPLESHLTYGDQMFFPVWETAARYGLPVAVHSDHSCGVMRPPTMLGYPSSYLELYSQSSNFVTTHLASLVGHGVFDRLESLTFVFADGGFDFATTLVWRLDKDWRTSRTEVPWMRQAPSKYLVDHIRFVVHRSDGEHDTKEYAKFIELNGLERVLIYGSNYPHWEYLEPRQFAKSLPKRLRAAIMEENARQLYRLPAAQSIQSA